MIGSQHGVLPDRLISQLIEAGAIRSSDSIRPLQIQPASLDLTLGAEAHRIRASFLPGDKRTISERLEEYSLRTADLRNGAVLEKGCVYIVRLQERLALPPGIGAVANAKSSTGRLDLLTRLVTDRGTEFDRVDAGYRGPLYAEICPRSFAVLVRTGTRLNQIRFRQGDTVLSDDQLRELQRTRKIVSGNASIGGGIGFSVDLGQPGELSGFRAKPHAGIIDVDEVGRYDPADFWDPVAAKERRIILDPGSFYILASREAVSIPPEYAAEMVPYIAMVGEFRVHYAGFFDPGFGHSESGGEGSKGVLEVRCHEVPFLLEHGQLVGRLAFERMSERPDVPYGSNDGANYQGQGLKLAKQFRQHAAPDAPLFGG